MTLSAGADYNRTFGIDLKIKKAFRRSPGNADLGCGLYLKPAVRKDPFHWIRVHVLQLLFHLLEIPNIEIVKSPLPEWLERVRAGNN